MQASPRSAYLRYFGHARGLMSIGLPLVGSNIAFLAMNMTDSLMLGWYDLTALAAVTVAGSYFFVLVILGSGFGMAVSPLVAEAEARENHTLSRRATRMALWLSVIYAVLVFPLWWWSEDILLLMGQEPQIAKIAQQYLHIGGFSLLPILFVTVFKNFLSALEHTRIILVATVGLAVLNIPMNWIFIYGNAGMPELGARGAAIATLTASLLSCLILIIYILRVFPAHQMFRRFWVSDLEAFRQVRALGLPIGFMGVAEGGMFSASSILAGWLGEVPLAAHGIVLQLSGMTFMAHLGLSQAMTIRAGQALGQRDEKLLRELTWSAFGVSLFWVAVTITLFLSIPGTLVGLFLDPGDPRARAVIEVGVVLMIMAALFQLVDAGQVLFGAALRGLQDTRVPMFLAIGSYWLAGIPSAYLFGFTFGMGAVGLWIGLCIGLAIACVALGWRYFGWVIKIGQRRTP